MIRIVTYEPQYKQDFIQLNKQWIETWFRLEQSDLDTFAHIDDNIIGHGGQIFLAIDESRQVVGCCALKPHPESDCHELAKMAVLLKLAHILAHRVTGDMKSTGDAFYSHSHCVTSE